MLEEKETKNRYVMWHVHAVPAHGEATSPGLTGPVMLLGGHRLMRDFVSTDKIGGS